MKHIIDIAVSYTKVETEKAEIDFPETGKYYISNAQSDWDYKLFAVVPKYPNYPNDTYLVVKVERGMQDYNDLRPTDCKSQYWKESSNYLRRLAIDILRGGIDAHEWSEITQDEFEAKRMPLLNIYKINL